LAVTAQSQDPPPESRVIGPYRLVRRLGTGGMGTVWEAADDRLGRHVAIKSLHPARPLTPTLRERLRREARALANLNHANVAQVFDLIEDGDDIHLVMELVTGISLGAKLIHGPLEPDAACDIALQVSRALAAAHEQRLVHRDLKADNVLLTDRGHVKVLDFGLAKHFGPEQSEDSLTEDGIVMGTSRAMSPEQAAGDDVDHRSDLFSLGSLLYEMLTGRHPFQSSAPFETMQRVIHHQPPPVRQLRPTVPAALDLLVESLMAKKAEDRPADANHVSAVLEAMALGPDTVTSERPVALRPAPKRGRRSSPWRVSRWLGLAAIVAGATTFGLWWMRRVPPQRMVAVAVTEPEDRGIGLIVESLVEAMPGLSVADPRAVAGCANVSPEGLGRATGADEVIRISRRGADLVLVREDTSSSRRLAGDIEFGATGGGTQGALRRAFPNRPPPDDLAGAADVADWSALASLRSRLTDPVGSSADLAAVTDLSELRQRFPKWLEPHLEEARVAAILAGHGGAEGIADRAVAAVAAARALAPDDQRVAIVAFEVAVRVQEPRDVHRTLAALATGWPRDPRLGWWRAEASAVLEGPAAAADHAITLPVPRAWTQLATMAGWEWSCGRADAARSHLLQATTCAPNVTSLRRELALVEVIHGDALRSLELTSHLAGDPDGVLLRALAHLRLRQSATALAELERDPSSDAVTAALEVVALESMERSGEARRIATDALARADDAGGRYRPAVRAAARAAMLAAVDRRTEAITELGHAVEAAPRDPGILLAAAWISARCGDATSAQVFAAREVSTGRR
jgi:hypothetical protein